MDCQDSVTAGSKCYKPSFLPEPRGRRASATSPPRVGPGCVARPGHRRAQGEVVLALGSLLAGFYRRGVASSSGLPLGDGRVLCVALGGLEVGGLVSSRTPAEGVCLRPTGERVVAPTAAQDVLARIPSQYVVAVGSVEGVISRSAAHRARAVAPTQQVVSVPAGDGVVAVLAEDDVSPCGAAKGVPGVGSHLDGDLGGTRLSPSLTVTVIVAVPERLAAALTVNVRLAPLPPTERPEFGTRFWLEEVALRVRALTSLSTSATVRLICPLVPLVPHCPPAATATLGASLTGLTVILKVCAALVSTPPLAGPPSSLSTTVTVALPLASGAGV